MAHSDDEIVSGIFARPKKQQGKWRPIINIKYLNSYLRKIPFKMTKVSFVMGWLKPGFFLSSIDLTDAYYSVPLHPSAWRFMRFKWRGVLYEYMVLLFGLSSSPRIFSKVVHVVIVFLRASLGILIVAYLDDLFIQAESAETCMLHTQITVLIFSILGFAISFEKSALSPSRIAEYIGFVWNTQDFTVKLPEAKLSKIISTATHFMNQGFCSARDLRSFLGFLESSRPAVPLARLNFRFLQQELQPFLEDWDPRRTVSLNAGALEDLAFWSQLTPDLCVSSLAEKKVTVSVATDASGNLGYGSHSSSGGVIQGTWSRDQAFLHINYKELYGAFMGVQAFMREGDCMEVLLDNKSAVFYVNRMGGTRSFCLNQLARDLWQLVLQRKGWLIAKWLPRQLNQTADLLSKTHLNVWEISVAPETLTSLWKVWFKPTIDLFASKKCHVTLPYCSLKRDPCSLGDSFNLEVWPDRAYAFPPTPVIQMVVNKIWKCRVNSLILIVPKWPGALWWGQISQMLLAEPIPLSRDSLFQMEGLKLPHLFPLVACLVSGARAPPCLMQPDI